MLSALNVPDPQVFSVSGKVFLLMKICAAATHSLVSFPDNSLQIFAPPSLPSSAFA
jgi:hypothetical protein